MIGIAGRGRSFVLDVLVTGHGRLSSPAPAFFRKTLLGISCVAFSIDRDSRASSAKPSRSRSALQHGLSRSPPSRTSGVCSVLAVRERWTLLLLAATFALGLVAALDAFRGDGTTARAPQTVETSPAGDLRRAGVSGVLYFSARTKDGCSLRALRLPDLRDEASFTFEFCRFDVSPEGNVVAGPPCPSDRVDIRPVDELASSWVGCAPAWKPNGELTFVRDGDVLTPDGEILIDDLALTAQRAFPRDRPVLVRHVRQTAWLTDTRLVAVLRNPMGEVADIVVIFDKGRVVPGAFLPAGASLYVSRTAQEIFVGGGGAGVQVFDHRGNFVSVSRFPFGSIAAVAYSPDGRWFALARPGNVCIYEERKPPPRPQERFPVTCLPFDAVDLAWR